MPAAPNIRILCHSPARAQFVRQALAAEGLAAAEGSPGDKSAPLADIVITDRDSTDIIGLADMGVISLAGGPDADVVLRPDASPRELGLACRLLAEVVQLRRAQRLHEDHEHRLEQLAYLDSLTELANRRAWDEELVRHVGSLARGGHSFCVALVDIDHFKKINDAHGHLVGDAVLRVVARALRAHVRDNDRVARLGGDEFGLLLPGVTAGFAAEVVDRIRVGALATAASHEESAIPFTASAGYSCAEPQAITTAEALYAAADRALNQAKTTGRNRTAF